MEETFCTARISYPFIGHSFLSRLSRKIAAKVLLNQTYAGQYNTKHSAMISARNLQYLIL